MKKATLEKTLTILANIDSPEAEEIRAEINAELSKGKEKADANRAVYAEMHDKVVEVMAQASLPVTAQEIAEATGLSRSKIVYGLTNYWSDEVVKDTTGKATKYSLA